METSPTINDTVYLVDDERAVREMLRRLVSTIGVEVRTFASAEEFLATYHPVPGGECLLCDLRMPGMDGMELQQRLLAMDMDLPIIFVTGYAEVNVAVDAMKHGAFDFLEKPFSHQALLGKLQAALQVSRVRHAQRIEHQATEARLGLLTPREHEVVRQVLDGKSSREIAESLGLSVRTVENHRGRILEKLHLKSTVDLVKLFS